MFIREHRTKRKDNRSKELGEAMYSYEQTSNKITNALLYRLS